MAVTPFSFDFCGFVLCNELVCYPTASVGMIQLLIYLLLSPGYIEFSR